MTHRLSCTPVALAAALAAALLPLGAHASSHREAPFITTAPKVDAVLVSITLSVLLHGSSATPIMALYQRRRRRNG